MIAERPIITGGCQCGAVRYAIDGPLGKAGICHCRMCQKAFGSWGAALVSVPLHIFRWSRGTPGTAMFARLSFRTLLFIGVPAWFAMRIGAEWIYSKEGWADVPDEPGRQRHQPERRLAVG